MQAKDFYLKYWTCIESYVDVCNNLDKYEDYEQHNNIELKYTKDLKSKKETLKKTVQIANNYY